MSTPTRSGLVAAAAGAALALAAGIGCDGNPGGDLPGKLEDQLTIRIGKDERTVVLGKGLQRTEVRFSAKALPETTQVTVRLSSGVRKEGAAPANDTSLQILTRGAAFAGPVVVKQTLPPPPAGKGYQAVHAPERAPSWVVVAPARPALPRGDGTVDEPWEIDVDREGLWAIAWDPEVAPPPDAGSEAAPPPPDAATTGDTFAREAQATESVARPDAPPGAGAAPQLVSLTPDRGAVGSTTVVQLAGFGFADPAVAMVSGTAVPTVFASATQLSAEIPAALTAAPGQLAVWVENAPGNLAARSNVLYFTVDAPPGAPEIVDYNPDNGVPGDKVLIAGRNLAAEPLAIRDSQGTTTASAEISTTYWLGETLDTVALVLPDGWSTGPITVSNSKGSFSGKIFNVGRNLSRSPGVQVAASSEYSITWSAARGADNDLLTSWFSANLDCASNPSCTSVPWFAVALASPGTVGRIAVRGNREYRSGYDFIRARLEIRDAAGTPLWGGSFALPEPDRDLDVLVTPPVAGASSVRFTSEQDESVEPGFSELEVFAP